MRAGLKSTPLKEEWLGKVLPAGSKIGVDAKLVSYEASKKMAEALKANNQLVLELSEDNLVDKIWSEKRALIRNPIVPLPVVYSGKSSADKIAYLQTFLKEKNFAGFIVSALDEVAWLFNLRGSDIPFNPLFFAYALVLQDSVTLYLEKSQLPKDGTELANVTVKEYDEIFDDLKALSGVRLLIAPTCNAALAMAAGGDANVVVQKSPVESEKSIKNEIELQGFRNCHIRDAAALVFTGIAFTFA